MKRIMYSPEIKWQVVALKEQGISNKEIMRQLNIKNETQIDTWWRWYRNSQSYRFEQPIGKQYTYGKGPKALGDLETAKLKISYLQMELDILKKILGALKK